MGDDELQLWYVRLQLVQDLFCQQAKKLALKKQLFCDCPIVFDWTVLLDLVWSGSIYPEISVLIFHEKITNLICFTKKEEVSVLIVSFPPSEKGGNEILKMAPKGGDWNFQI